MRCWCGVGVVSISVVVGRQVRQQRAEAMHRSVVGGSFGACFADGVVRSPGRRHRRYALDRGGFFVIVVKQDRRQVLSHMPLDIVGQHAQKHVGSDSAVQAMVNRTNIEVHWLEAAERSFHDRQPFVRTNGLFCIHGLLASTGSDHIDAVQGGLRGNLVFISRIAE